jgi:EAL domain-containing protein (putative c-di-GMP-specific phosphodiesterase class I)
VAQRVLDVLDGPSAHFREPFHAPASIGIAMSPTGSAEELLQEADAAMYAAKAAGRRTIRFFDASLASSAEDRYRLGSDLRAALGDRQLELAYQPIVSLRTGAVLGTEGLARWRHPHVGAVPPDRFVPVALETGLGAELDFSSIRSATQDLAAFRAAGAMDAGRYVAVNLSARTLDHPLLLDELDRAVNGNGLRPEDLVLEVTEATMVSRAGEGVKTLRALAEAGHVVAIDDFGTGHSALAYLQDLPAGLLKIDRTFVRDLATSSAARAITASIVSLAHGLQMQVVAEGVETAAQADVLRDLDCDGGQGWLWAPAGSRDDVLDTALLKRVYRSPGRTGG